MRVCENLYSENLTMGFEPANTFCWAKMKSFAWFWIACTTFGWQCPVETTPIPAYNPSQIILLLQKILSFLIVVFKPISKLLLLSEYLYWNLLSCTQFYKLWSRSSYQYFPLRWQFRLGLCSKQSFSALEEKRYQSKRPWDWLPLTYNISLALWLSSSAKLMSTHLHNTASKIKTIVKTC